MPHLSFLGAMKTRIAGAKLEIEKDNLTDWGDTCILQMTNKYICWSHCYKHAMKWNLSLLPSMNIINMRHMHVVHVDVYRLSHILCYRGIKWYFVTYLRWMLQSINLFPEVPNFEALPLSNYTFRYITPFWYIIPQFNMICQLDST